MSEHEGLSNRVVVTCQCNHFEAIIFQEHLDLGSTIYPNGDSLSVQVNVIDVNGKSCYSNILPPKLQGGLEGL